jgi:S-adenosylmethionine synthetase
MPVLISQFAAGDEPVEMVERKGLGHPDSICDALAQTLSQNLCRYYLETFGVILHHNVDKALLCGGRSEPAFGGGEVVEPIDIYLAGRACSDVNGKRVPLADLAIGGSRRWLSEHLHALDAVSHVRLHNKVRSGSRELAELFERAQGAHATPLANDTSFGVGYAPMSPLERLVVDLEQALNARNRVSDHPAWGEDTKIMAVRRGSTVALTVACAMIGRHVARLDDYLAEVAEIRRRASQLAYAAGFADCQVRVNAADDPAAGSIYLTVTGTSAEAGDDGEVGRGNRVNGLITPYRPMSLEAAAGKNPVSHVGMIYNVLARQIAEQIVSTLPEVAAAQCFLVSEIGRPIDDPAIAHVRLATRDGSPVAALRDRTEEIVRQALRDLPGFTQRYALGSVELF